MDRLSAGRTTAVTKRYRLIGPDRQPYESAVPGTLGGTKAGLYGRLDCPSALRALARPNATYGRRRVFFADAASAVSAGFRPCAVCLPEDYRAWKAGRQACDSASFKAPRPRPP